MAMKRKRKARSSGNAKKIKVDQFVPGMDMIDSPIRHAVLQCYYRHVYTLRGYILNRLSAATVDEKVLQRLRFKQPMPTSDEIDIPARLDNLLDGILVGVNDLANPHAVQRRARELATFSQLVPDTKIGKGLASDECQQIEVVNFVIWLLFHRPLPSRLPHLLAQGFEKAAGAQQTESTPNTASGIPEVTCHFPNEHVETISSPVWCHLLSLLGIAGDLIMIDLLVEAGIFVPLGSGNGNYYQLSGIPLSVLPVINPLGMEGTDKSIIQSDSRRDSRSSHGPRRPSEIRLVRSRMFYARAALNAKGNVRFGVRHIHVLNRYPDLKNQDQTVHIMKHVFPRQFGLHNPFTSKVDSRETAYPFKDYTLRDSEIKIAEEKRCALLPATATDRPNGRSKIPKRLRGRPLDMISKFRTLHASCPYVELLRYYCPVDLSVLASLDINGTKYATPDASVSAFCRAVLSKVLPADVWGEGEDGTQNKRQVMKLVGSFVCSRKFESINLNSILETLKVSSIPWLQPPEQQQQRQHHHDKMSLSDFEKRKELLAEFMYYLFDSFLIPLIRTNFHVTESNTHKNRLFYFRHDIWRLITEPSTTEIKSNMYEETNTKSVQKLLAKSPLGFSQIRLLPKASGFRPIANLRRRPQYMRGGQRFLGKSINSTLLPVFKVLNYSKSRQPSALGSSLFSVSDIHVALKTYKTRLSEANLWNKPLYFVKVDVKACFDSIPQAKIVTLVKQLLSGSRYSISKHAEVRQPQRITIGKGASIIKPRVKYQSEGQSAKKASRIQDIAEDLLGGRRRDTVFVGNIQRQVQDKRQVLELLDQHINHNLVKIGKKYYRQKKGIPQGSIMSSLLCNLFYGKLEEEDLSFICRTDTILLRLIDDFLLISTELPIADSFVRIMHNGLPEYGITVKVDKSLTNFNLSIQGLTVPTQPGTKFPYCGIMIDVIDLNVTRDQSRLTPEGIPDSLTVERSTLPGKAFREKALNALRIQLQSIFFDTDFNTIRTALNNLYSIFYSSAQRFYHYERSLPRASRLTAKLATCTIEDMISAAHTSIKTKKRSLKSSYACAIRRDQTRWLACKAFYNVFRGRQTGHERLLDWLRLQLKASWPAPRSDAGVLSTVGGGCKRFKQVPGHHDLTLAWN